MESKGHDQKLRKRDFWSIRLDSTMWRVLYIKLYFSESFFNGLSGPLVLKTKKAIFDQKIIFLRILTKFGQYALKNYFLAKYNFFRI